MQFHHNSNNQGFNSNRVNSPDIESDMKRQPISSNPYKHAKQKPNKPTKQNGKRSPNLFSTRVTPKFALAIIILFGAVYVFLSLFYLPQINFLQFSFISSSDSSEDDGYARSSGQGMFPQGCRWRDIFVDGTKNVTYEFWDETRQRWTTQTPNECFVKGVRNPLHWKWYKESPRSEVNCTDTYCLYYNLWYLNGRWFTLVDGDRPVPAWKMSRNQEISPIHVHDAVQFPATVNFRVISGDTLWIDYIFYSHPTAIGHWGEMMFPLYSVLKQISFQRPAQQVVLLHLKRWHLMEWVRAVVGVALGVKPNSYLPPILIQEEKDSLWTQLRSQLQGLPENEWVCFERVLVIRDIFTGGNRTFQTTEDAQNFRKELYEHYELPTPLPKPSPLPRQITYQRKSFNRRILNEEEFVNLLKQYGEVTVTEYNFTSSFTEQLTQISKTTVFVAVHTSNLANTFFLPPGSAVIELIQQNWGWNQMDRSFKDQTDKMGDLHHFAWRARLPNQTAYLNARDSERFKDWSFLDCRTEECVEAHTNVDVVVNLRELKELLDSRLPLVFAGKSVQEAWMSWPEGA